MGRAPCCEKVGLRRGRWTQEEDEILINYIQQHGEGSWRSLPKNAGLLRCGKSCRLRWINYLRTDLKRGNITPQEEETIIRLHSVMGNRWSLIAGQLSGRTDNEIKNYWNSHLSRKIHTFVRPNGNPNGEKIIINMTHASARPKHRGGRTSRAAMQRNRANNIVNNNNNNNDNQLKNTSQQNDEVLIENMNKLGPLNGNGTMAVPMNQEKDNIDDVNESSGPQSVVSELLDIEDIMDLDLDPDPFLSDPKDFTNNDNNNGGPSVTYEMGPKIDGPDQCSSTRTGQSNGGSSTASSSYGDHHDESMVDLGWYWDWEIGTVDMGQEYDQVWNDKEEIISWLWENDEENKLQDFNYPFDKNKTNLSTLSDVVDAEKEQAMVAWLLS